ncbi:MAG: hypothetical protein RLZZ175_2926 [Bacteroidota bacterium]|jgi:hypothetical protein
MKKFVIGCLSIPIILIVLFLTDWILHEIRKNTIRIDEQEISALDNEFVYIANNWKGVRIILKSQFNKENFLTKKEFVQLLKLSNIPESKYRTLIKILPDDSSIEICDESFRFELYSSSSFDPELFFPDNYRHYISLDSDKQCYEHLKDRRRILNNLLGKKLRYKIDIHTW